MQGSSRFITSLVSALALLTANPQTAMLAETAKHVTITDTAPQPMPPGIGSYFFAVPSRPLIWIGPDYANATPEVLAPEIAHELTHFEDFTNGVSFSVQGTACYERERHGLKMQASVWDTVRPSTLDQYIGTPSYAPASENTAVSTAVDGPMFEPWLHYIYASLCGADA